MLTPRFYLLGLFSALGLTSSPVFAADSAPTPIPLQGMSSADVAKLNNTLKKLIVAQDPSTQAAFDGNPTFAILKGNSAIEPAPFNPARHDANVAIAKKGDIDLLFAGDS